MAQADLKPEDVLRLEQDSVVLLDQRRLPSETAWLQCRSSEEVAEAIRTLAVRGAPAIGIAAAMGYALAAARGEAGALAARYARACEREIGPELRDSVLIQRHLFADRRRIARAIRGTQSAPVLTKLILDFAVGRLSYAALRRRMLARAPLLAAHLMWARLRSTRP